MLTFLVQIGCEASIEQATNSSRIGDEKTDMSAVRAAHSQKDTESAEHTLTTLCKVVTSRPLVNKTYAKGSPSKARAMLEERYIPNGVVL